MIYKTYCKDKFLEENKECIQIKCDNWDLEKGYCKLNKMQAVNAMYHNTNLNTGFTTIQNSIEIKNIITPKTEYGDLCENIRKIILKQFSVGNIGE